MRNRLSWILVLSLVAWAGGCASVEPVMDFDLDGFTLLVNETVAAGMPIREARKAILARFPPPEEDTEAAPMIAMAGAPVALRRFTMVWPTTTPGIKLVLTFECDREARLVRWSTGPLYAR